MKTVFKRRYQLTVSNATRRSWRLKVEETSIDYGNKDGTGDLRSSFSREEVKEVEGRGMVAEV